MERVIRTGINHIIKIPLIIILTFLSCYTQSIALRLIAGCFQIFDGRPYCDPERGIISNCTTIFLDIGREGASYILHTICPVMCRTKQRHEFCPEACIYPDVKNCSEVCSAMNCGYQICYPANGPCYCSGDLSKPCIRAQAIISDSYDKMDLSWIYITCGIVIASISAICLIFCCARSRLQPTIVLSRRHSLTNSHDYFTQRRVNSPPFFQRSR